MVVAEDEPVLHTGVPQGVVQARVCVRVCGLPHAPDHAVHEPHAAQAGATAEGRRHNEEKQVGTSTKTRVRAQLTAANIGRRG